MLHTHNDIKINLSRIEGAVALSQNILIKRYVINQLTHNQCLMWYNSINLTCC